MSNLNEKSYMCIYPKNQNNNINVKLDKVHSPLKILAQGDMIKSFKNGEKISPIHARIGLTSACNMRCKFCNFHSNNETDFYDCFNYKDFIETDKAIKFLQDFYELGGKAVTFCGSGECTIHPGFVDICMAANKMGLKLGIITNGSMLHKKEIAECIAKTFTWVRIGMNAGTEETFHGITTYPKEGFNQIFDSIAYLRNNSVEEDFVIGVNFVITLDNYKEMKAAASLAKNAKSHYIRFEPEFYTALAHNTIMDRLDEIEKLLNETSKLSTPDFEVSIPKLDRGKMRETEEVEGDFEKCNYSKFVTALGADGYIYSCPQVHLGSKYRIGEVINSGYKNFIESGKIEEWDKKHSCRKDLCKTCFYRPQNEVIEWAVKDKIDIEKVIEEYEKDFPVTLHKLFI